MRKKILEGLKTKYSNLGFGDKAYDGVADYLEKTITDEEQIDNAISGVEGLLKTFQGETDRERTKRSELEKKLQELEAGKPKEKEEEEKKEKEPEWAKTLREQFEKMSAKEAEREKKAQILKIAKTKGIPEDLLDLLDIPADEDLETYFTSAKQKLINLGLVDNTPAKGEKNIKDVEDKIAEAISKETEKKIKKSN